MAQTSRLTSSWQLSLAPKLSPVLVIAPTGNQTALPALAIEVGFCCFKQHSLP
jgi:hypothetical protein